MIEMMRLRGRNDRSGAVAAKILLEFGLRVPLAGIYEMFLY
jgi:hypothetical protein